MNSRRDAQIVNQHVAVKIHSLGKLRGSRNFDAKLANAAGVSIGQSPAFAWQFDPGATDRSERRKDRLMGIEPHIRGKRVDDSANRGELTTFRLASGESFWHSFGSATDSMLDPEQRHWMPRDSNCLPNRNQNHQIDYLFLNCRPPNLHQQAAKPCDYHPRS